MVYKYNLFYYEGVITIKNINTIAIVTLGCAKNEVDSEMLLAYFTHLNLKITTDLSQADIIVLNTCGFISDAKSEGIKYIFDLLDYKKIGSCKLFFVVGCMAKRYKKELLENIPQIDEVIGVDEYGNLANILKKYFGKVVIPKGIELEDRIISTTFPSAYVKIAEGCDNRCNYCAIPLIRGCLKSRTIESIVKEVSNLADDGYSEINIIAQDTTNYGIDIYGGESLDKLLEQLIVIPNIHWIRILYMYPGKVTNSLLNVIKNSDKICKYFDIPIQHINDDVLKSMNRHCTKKDIFQLIHKIRKLMPEAIIRTTVMVGHPDETVEAHEELKDALEKLQFDRLGAFIYSAEEDTVSCKKEQIPYSLKKKRYNEIMSIQQQIVKRDMPKLLEKKVEVLVTGISDDEKYFVARSCMDAPDVDPKIYIKIDDTTCNKIIIGEYIDVVIKKISGYDYIADLEERND